MRIARAILCLLTACAVAAAPVIAGYAPAWAGVSLGHGTEHHAAAASTHGHHHAAMQGDIEAGAADAVPCPHDHRVPPQKSPDHCGSMAGCALCYATALPALDLTLAQPATRSAALSWHPSGHVPDQAAAGPFRPPRA